MPETLVATVEFYTRVCHWFDGQRLSANIRIHPQGQRASCAYKGQKKDTRVRDQRASGVALYAICYELPRNV